MIEDRRAKGGRARAGLCTAYLVIGIVLIYPLTIVEMPPLLDYPLHVARMHILLSLNTEPDLASIYAVDWQLVPNLAIDLAVLAMGQFMSVETAARIFLGVCVAATVLSVAILHRVNFGYWSWWPLLTVLPAYHGAFNAGFVNFSFGLAFVPLAVAMWLWSRHRSISRQVAFHVAATAILYLCHIIALGLYALIVGAYELGQWMSRSEGTKVWRDQAKRALVLLVPLSIAAATYIAVSMGEVLQREERVLYGEWRFLPKIRGVLMPVLTYDHLLDAAALAVLIGIPLALFSARRLDVRSGFTLPIVLVLGLFMLLPGHLMDSSFIMERLPIAAVLIAIGSTRPQAVSMQSATIVAIVVLSLAVCRSHVIAENWLASDAFYQRAKMMSDHVVPGSSVLVVSPFSSPEIHDMDLWRHRFSDDPDWYYALINIPSLHSLPIVPLTQRATFCQLHFVWPDKQVLRLTPAYRRYAYGDGANATFSPKAIVQKDRTGTIRLSKRVDGFRYVLVLYTQHIEKEELAMIEALKPVYADADMLLLDLAGQRTLAATGSPELRLDQGLSE